MTDLLLIRHGESAHNAAGLIQGQHDAPLSPRGRVQARRLAARLAADPPDALYCSDLSRAFDTAEPIAAACGLPLHPDPRLREVDMGRWSNRSWREVQRLYPSQWAQFQREEPTFKRGGGECATEVQQRMVAAIEEIVARHGGQRVAIVSHGFAIRTFLAHFLGLPLTLLSRRFAIDNSAVSRLQFNAPPAPGTLLSLNDTCHLYEPLPHDLETQHP